MKQSTGLLKFDRKHCVLLAFLVSAFLILISLHIHGYSITVWHDFIDQSPHQEILLGKAQGIRSDDYLGLTAYLSQEAHVPSFPIVNSLIGDGQNMLLLNVPVKYWTIIFRPQNWGGFLGGEVGIAWRWWFNFLGLFYVFFLVFMLISKNSFFVSIFSSLILLFSPFFQFWSLNGAPMAIFMGVCWVFVICLLYSNSNFKIFLFSILLGWSGTAFILCHYPPYIITLSYLFIFLLIGFAWREKKEGRVIDKIPIKLLGLLIAVLIVAISYGGYYRTVEGPWHLLAGTVYPGQRVISGGDFSLTRLFSNSFIPFRHINDWSYFTNICEASSFLFFFPILGAMILWNSFKKREGPNIFSLLIMVYLTLLLVWMFLGFPTTLSKFSLFNRVAEGRTLIGFGIANLALIVSYFSSSSIQNKNKLSPFILGILWLIFLLYLGRQLHRSFAEIGMREYLFFAFLMTFLGYALIKRWRFSLVLLAAISIYSTAWFNPLVRGGVSYLKENDLARKINELDAQLGGDSAWAVFGSMQLSNLLRVLGVRALNGIHYYPQFELWRRFDPKGDYLPVYNRYAHVIFSFSDQAEVQFSNPYGDQVQVAFNPRHSDFKKLGIDYLLNVGSDSALLDIPELKKVYSFRDKQIYQVVEDQK